MIPLADVIRQFDAESKGDSLVNSEEIKEQDEQGSEIPANASVESLVEVRKSELDSRKVDPNSVEEDFDDNASELIKQEEACDLGASDSSEHKDKFPDCNAVLKNEFGIREDSFSPEVQEIG